MRLWELPWRQQRRYCSWACLRSCCWIHSVSHRMKRHSLGWRTCEILGDGTEPALSLTTRVTAAPAPGWCVQTGTESWGLSDLKTMRCSDTAVLEVREINVIVKVHWWCDTPELLQWVKKKEHLSKSPVSRIPCVQWTSTCSWLPAIQSFLSQMFLQSFQHLQGPGAGRQELHRHGCNVGKNKKSRSVLGKQLWQTSAVPFLTARVRGRKSCRFCEFRSCLPCPSPESSQQPLLGSLVPALQISVLALPPLGTASVLRASGVCDRVQPLREEFHQSSCLGLLLCSCNESFLAGSPKVFKVFP